MICGSRRASFTRYPAKSIITGESGKQEEKRKKLEEEKRIEFGGREQGNE
jgi:hypothetical protein